MSFYLKPPRGLINYHILENCVFYRLQFYDTVKGNGNIDANIVEYLLEDTAYDRAGHYMLRLQAFNKFNFMYRFIECETKILQLRLDSYKTANYIKHFLKTTLRHAKELQNLNNSRKMVNFIKQLINICNKMLSRSYCEHILNCSHTEHDKCKLFAIYIPFEYCTSMIRNREVELNKGYAKITCEKWKDLLVSMFKTYILIVFDDMKDCSSVEEAMMDCRISNILSSLTTFNTTCNKNYLALTKLQGEVHHFPLCMLNLYELLKREHRLHHNARFDFSLFLKDIGLSLNDSISFWQNEYSKDSNSSCCSHNWKNDEKRFVYGIRHLYGLEGRKKSYCARSCNYFIERSLGAIEVGGCPFQHFDNDVLKSILLKYFPNNLSAVQEMMDEKAKENPQNACKIFYSLNKENCNSNVTFTNPVQYFLLHKKK